METPKFTPNDQEHPIQSNRILPLTQKRWPQPKTYSNLGWLIKVRFQNTFIEHHNTRHNQRMVSRLRLFLDFREDFLFCEADFGLETLEGQGGADFRG